MWMKGHYDHMPEPIRKRLMDSPFNICAACVDLLANSHDYIKAINKLEADILAELGPFGPQ